MTPNTHTTIKVTVHYIAATKPFMTNPIADIKVAVIKTEALTAFGLVEDQHKVYKMFSNKVELSDLNATIGSVADGKPEVQIDLEEFIIQGK